MPHAQINNEKELQILYQTLRRTRGFQLYLVECNNPQLYPEILKSLKTKLKTAGITIYYHHLADPVTSIDDFLPRGFKHGKKEVNEKVILVSGLENSFAAPGEPQHFLHRLNYARDSFPKRIPVPLVILLPIGAFKLLLTEAHDFWSWRSGTFYFSTPGVMVQSNKIVDLPQKEQQTPGLSEKSYKEQLRVFSGFWEDLKHQPDSEINRIRTSDILEAISILHCSYAKNLAPGDHQARQYLEKALEFQLKSLEIKEAESVKSNLQLAHSYNNLSLIYQSLGQLQKALEFQLKTVAINEQVLENDHPFLATSCNNLAMIYYDLEEYEKAFQFATRAADIYQRLFPGGHPEMEIVKKNLKNIKKHKYSYLK